MAEHLASIFGTEKDRVNCPFYFKIGACLHGDRCSRLHTKPSVSPTLLLSNMYQRPDRITPGGDANFQPIHPRVIKEHFEDFYEDLFEELSKYGDIESLNVCDNLVSHMVGNVYVQFREEEHAANALKNLTGRYYAGLPIVVEFSPVTDFREAMCWQFEEDKCNRGGSCNFVHLKRIGRELRRELFGRYRKRHSHERRSYDRRYDDYYHESRGKRHRSRSPGYRRGGARNRSPYGRRKRSPSREGSEERRAKIERWNKEREEEEENVAKRSSPDRSYKNNDQGNSTGYNYGGDHCAFQNQQQMPKHNSVYGC